MIEHLSASEAIPDRADPALAKAEPASKPAAPSAASSAGFAEDTDLSLLKDFIAESREYAASAEASLLALEIDPEDPEATNTVFRAFHTVKGTSGFLGLTLILQFAHHAESLFDRFRTGELRSTGEIADLSLHSVDMLQALLDAVEEARDAVTIQKPKGYDELMGILSDPGAIALLQESAAAGEPTRLGDILVAEGKVKREVVEAVEASKGDEPLGLAMVRSKAVSLTDVARALRKQQRAASENGSHTTVRVRTDRLDLLMDLVGELVTAQSMISRDTVVTASNDGFTRKISHAGKIVRELHEMSVSMRMAPLEPTFQKMARLVRDVAKKSGKQVQLVTEGEDTEVDRKMVDMIGGPLMHMIRNAVDHGIEMPEVREACGKNPVGTVVLRAYHSGGNVVVEMQDDGKGLDRDKIVQKANSKGLVSADRVLSDTEAFNLIFAPGFSTAEEVTDLSGRGVGMDVVKRNVESLRGRIDIASEAGRGSTFSIRVPLTV